MKIYNKIVIDMATNRLVTEDSFEYFGEIACCDSGGGTSVSFPGPTEQEIALQQMQLDLLTRQGEEAELMRPHVLQSMGLKDVGGELVQMSEEERYAVMNQLEQGQYNLTKQQQERQALAYAGELPISPGMESSLQKQEMQLAEALSQRLGPNWQATTSGQQAMGELRKRTELLREEARRGEISSGGGALFANLGQLQAVGALKGTKAMGFPGRTSGLFAEAGQAMAPYQMQRQGMFSADMYGAQARASSQAGLMGGIGSLLGTGITAYGTYAGLAAMSSKIMKKNIKTITKATDKVKKLRGVNFDWKSNNEHELGVVAEELEQVIPEAIFRIDGIRHVKYHMIIPILIEAVKEQQKQLDMLKEKPHA